MAETRVASNLQPGPYPAHRQRLILPHQRTSPLDTEKPSMGRIHWIEIDTNMQGSFLIGHSPLGLHAALMIHV
jgi:hypothetical protein